MSVEATEETLRARVHGQPFLQWPQDLFIPPDALEVFLETFEGPLDLLLYLIRRQNLNILDIPIAEITQQYMDYVELMKDLRLDLAAEYLVMAALLCEIKSRMLLPRSEEAEEESEDPRAELVRRLLEYERFQQAARALDELPRLERDWWLTTVEVPSGALGRPPPQVELHEILAALHAVLGRVKLSAAHRVEQESLSLRERMTQVLERLDRRGFMPFVDLFDLNEGRPGVVVTFLAVLELIKSAVLELVQTEPFAAIHVRTRLAADETAAAEA
jgi:segregation and condensation protein A